MKRIICTAFAALIGAAGAISLSGCDSTAEVCYTLSEDGTYYILSGISGNKRALKEYDIPSTYGEDNLPVKVIGDEAFFGSSLRLVTIPDSVETIGIRAFMSCDMTRVEIPQSVTEICYAAFADCTDLREITVPESVTSLGERAFSNCSSLEKAYLKCNVTDLKRKVLSNVIGEGGSDTYTHTQLTEIYISSAVKKIDATAFEGNFITDIYF
ncbi:MAG: leucine-rich repeat domain-containing protein, partial [Candidatus Coproplasma sp.]